MNTFKESIGIVALIMMTVSSYASDAPSQFTCYGKYQGDEDRLEYVKVIIARTSPKNIGGAVYIGKDPKKMKQIYSYYDLLIKSQETYRTYHGLTAGGSWSGSQYLTLQANVSLIKNELNRYPAHLMVKGLNQNQQIYASCKER